MDSVVAALAGPGVDRVLDLARRHLQMDVAYLSEFTDGKQVYRGLAGDAASFGCEVGDGPALESTYCLRMVDGLIPGAIPDTAVDPEVRDLPITAAGRIGAYVGVPVWLKDGSLYGTLCALSHDAQLVDDRDARFLAMLAELVSEDVSTQRQAAVDRDRICELIEHNRVKIALQPIVTLATGELCGVEALARFGDGWEAPDRVFASAHRVGVGTELERLCLQEAFALLPIVGPGNYLAVNLTPSVAAQLANGAEVDPGGPDVPYTSLVLEITEHAAVENYVALRDSLGWARERGLRLAIDDAGAGYASLHHIVELAPDIIKVDRCLIHGMAGDRARRSVVAAFVALARDLGANVVAEGVETVADLEAAAELGVDAAQGYLLARPSTDHDEVARWIGRSSALPARSTA